jgi:hypothetical protein
VLTMFGLHFALTCILVVQARRLRASTVVHCDAFLARRLPYVGSSKGCVLYSVLLYVDARVLDRCSLAVGCLHAMPLCVWLVSECQLLQPRGSICTCPHLYPQHLFVSALIA